MAPMADPTRPLLTSTANPRVRAAAALRDRRERDRTGLTAGRRCPRAAPGAGGRRPRRRGLRVRAVAGRSRTPRVVLDLLRATHANLSAGQRAGLREARLRRASRRASSPSSGPRRWTSPTWRCPMIPSSSSSRASRSPATSGRSCAPPMARAPTPSSSPSPRTDPSTRTPSGPAPGPIFSVPLAAAPTAGVLAWLRDQGVRIVAARVERRPALHRGRPDRAARDRRSGARRTGLTDGLDAVRDVDGRPPADARARRTA